MTTELLKGKSVEEAKELKAEELAADLGELPPMKIHCGQLVEGALQNALGGEVTQPSGETSQTLSASMQEAPKGKIKIVTLEE